MVESLLRIIPKERFLEKIIIEFFIFYGYIECEFNKSPSNFMKIYDTSYGPDTFGHIRTGLITEMFLTFDGFIKPDIGDHLRISCLFKGVVRDVYTVVIEQVCDCVAEPNTVLIRIEKKHAKEHDSGSSKIAKLISFTVDDVPAHVSELAARRTLH